MLKDKSKVACFTGHRPQKLSWGYNEKDERCLRVKEKARERILNAINDGYTTFISGLAMGFDMICAEIVLEVKKDNPELKLVGAIPCLDQPSRWSESYKRRYKNIVEKLDHKVCKCTSYVNGCMQERNRFMIDNSSLCIALYNGKSGGTAQTVKDAEKKGLKLAIINPEE